MSKSEMLQAVASVKEIGAAVGKHAEIVDGRLYVNVGSIEEIDVQESRRVHHPAANMDPESPVGGGRQRGRTETAAQRSCCAPS